MNSLLRWTYKKYRNKAGMETQEDYPTEKQWKCKTRRLLYKDYVMQLMCIN